MNISFDVEPLDAAGHKQRIVVSGELSPDDVRDPRRLWGHLSEALDTYYRVETSYGLISGPRYRAVAFPHIYILAGPDVFHGSSADAAASQILQRMLRDYGTLVAGEPVIRIRTESTFSRDEIRYFFGYGIFIPNAQNSYQNEPIGKLEIEPVEQKGLARPLCFSGADGQWAAFYEGQSGIAFAATPRLAPVVSDLLPAQDEEDLNTIFYLGREEGLSGIEAGADNKPGAISFLAINAKTGERNGKYSHTPILEGEWFVVNKSTDPVFRLRFYSQRNIGRFRYARTAQRQPMTAFNPASVSSFSNMNSVASTQPKVLPENTSLTSESAHTFFGIKALFVPRPGTRSVKAVILRFAADLWPVHGSLFTPQHFLVLKADRRARSGYIAFRQHAAAPDPLQPPEGTALSALLKRIPFLLLQSDARTGPRLFQIGNKLEVRIPSNQDMIPSNQDMSDPLILMHFSHLQPSTSTRDGKRYLGFMACPQQLTEMASGESAGGRAAQSPAQIPLSFNTFGGDEAYSLDWLNYFVRIIVADRFRAPRELGLAEWWQETHSSHTYDLAWDQQYGIVVKIDGAVQKKLTQDELDLGPLRVDIVSTFDGGQSSASREERQGQAHPMLRQRVSTT